MATTLKLREIQFEIKVPFYAYTYKAKGTKNAQRGKANLQKFYDEIIALLTADGWTVKTMGETLDCGKSTCPELTKGEQQIYCHPEELTGVVDDEKKLAALLGNATTFHIKKRMYGDIYICHSKKEAEQLYADTYPNGIEDVVREVVFEHKDIYGGKKGDWIDTDSAKRIIGHKVYIHFRDTSGECGSLSLAYHYAESEIERLIGLGKISKGIRGEYKQDVIRWSVKIEVTFPKKVSGIGERERYDLETFTVEVDGSKSAWDQSCEAFEEACKRGHNPNKNIRMHWVDDCPCKDADGENMDVEISCPNGRKNGSLRA